MKYYTNEEITNRANKTAKRIEIFKAIILFFILIIIVYNVVLIVKAIVVSNKTPSVFGFKTFSIISGSMMPTINVGDIIIVKEFDEYKENDIISFRKNDKIITHRIYKIEEVDNKKHYITKGDNNNTEDEGFIEKKDIEGKTIKIIPKLGNITIFLRKKEVIFIIASIFAISYIHDMKKNSKKDLRRQKREILNEKKEENKEN